MVSAGDLRRGTKILFKGEPYTVLEFQHVKPGKGPAYMRTKMKNLISGLVHEETFRTEDKLETPDLTYKEMLFIYKEDGLYNFLDQETYEQVAFNKEQLGDVVDFMKEQAVYTVLYFGERPIAVNPPLHMELKVVDAPPGVRGDTAQGGATKSVTLESGVVLQVPLFVEEGDLIKVDTRDYKYIERVKNK